MAWSLLFLGYLRTLSLKFQKARTKIGVFLGLSSWLSQFSWDSQKGRPRKTPVLVRAFWNFKRKVLKYPRNCRLHATLIPNLVKPLIYTIQGVLCLRCLLRLWKNNPVRRKPWKQRIDLGENTLWSTAAFSSNPSSLRPVFWTTTELSSTSFTEFLSTPEFLSTSELSSNWVLI
mgnify:CR=1 FL=1